MIDAKPSITLSMGENLYLYIAQCNHALYIIVPVLAG